MVKEFVMLRVNCSRCNAEAWVNGLPVSRVAASGFPLDSRPILEYLLPGNNQFVLLVEPGTNPSNPTAAGKPFVATSRTFATLDVLSGPQGAFPEDPSVRRLATLEWRPAQGSPVQPPVQLQTSVLFNVALPTWSWQKATPLSMSADLNATVQRFLAAIANRLNQRDVRPYVVAAQTKFRELAVAYGTTAAELTDKFVAQFNRLSAAPDFRLVTPAFDTMALRVCADGQIVDCLDTGFEPLLRAAKRESDGVTPIRYPTKIAIFGQEIRIVR
jgi:hypothetical protein